MTSFFLRRRPASEALSAASGPAPAPASRHPALSVRLLGSSALALAVLAGCSRADPPPEPIRAVKLITVAPMAGRSEQVFAGDVRAQIESHLGFRVGGKLLKRQADIGERVKAGEVLAELDPQDLRLAAEAARAQVAAARTNRDLASADFKRYEALKAQNFISGAELDRREATLKAAQASLDQAQAQSAAQGNQAAYAVLRADTAGVITAVNAEPGQVVAAGAPVVQLAQDGPRDAVFAVPEDQVRSFVVGQAVEVRSWSHPDAEPVPARVREVGAAADPVTRTFTVKVALEGPAPPLGSTVSVNATGVDTRSPSAIRIPTSALRRDGNATTVWLLDESSMTVREQPVVVSGIAGNDVTIASGLTPGMRVVAAGVHVLAPGQKVSVYESPGEQNIDKNSALAHSGKSPIATKQGASALPSAPPSGDPAAPAGVTPAAR